MFNSEKKKKYLVRIKELEDLEREEEEKMYTRKVETPSSYYQSTPGSNYINLFKSRKLQKSSTKTSSNGSSFRITTTNLFKTNSKSSNRNYSPTSSIASPFLKKRSIASTTSPDKHFNSNRNFTLFEIKKLVYVNDKTKDHLKEVANEQEKTFVLEVPVVTFKAADTISIMPECSLDVLYQLENVKANRLYLEY